MAWWSKNKQKEEAAPVVEILTDAQRKAVFEEMAKGPAKQEYKLRQSIVQDVLSEQIPDLAPIRAETYSEGWDYEVFLINEKHMFRFAKRAEMAMALQKEAAVLGGMGKELGLNIPKYEWLAHGGEKFPAIIGGYTKLPGGIAATLEPTDLDLELVLEQVVTFLKALHGKPASLVNAARLPVIKDSQLTLPKADEAGHLKEWLQRIGGDISPERLEAAKTFAVGLAGPPLPPARPVIVHGQLHSAHILVDEEQRKLSGVIGWSKIALAHPIIDYVGWYAWLGRAFAQKILERMEIADTDAWLDWMQEKGFHNGMSHLFHAHTSNIENDKSTGIQHLWRVLDA